MKLYERYGDNGFHSCISTTFGIDFDAYENIVLPRLRGASCSNNILLVDSRMLSYALDGASPLPEHAGRYYTVTGVQTGAVFHPKITLQFGRHGGRMVISSANMTTSGLAGNLELAGMVECRPQKSGEAALIAAAWAYLEDVLDRDDQASEHQLRWLRTRTSWLFDTEPAAGAITLTDNSAAALLTSDGSGATAGIGSRFADFMEGERVKRLVVLSPYWDEDLAALGALVRRIAPSRVLVLIDRQTQRFPANAVGNVGSAEVYDLNAFGGSRFIHAKAIIAETSQADHVLYGSANCTAAALGTGTFAGVNYEACLYRRLPPQTSLAGLGLEKAIAEGGAIRIQDLPAYRQEELIPLAHAAQRSPGQFECSFDTLFWRPGGPGIEGSIELLDAATRPLAVQLTPLIANNERRHRFQIDGSRERLAFARLRFADGTVSGPAIVMLVDVLREIVKEARSKKTESAANQLSDEAEEGLWLWEVLNDLETAELAQQQDASPGATRPRVKADEDETEEQHRRLSYEQFIAGRQLRPKDHSTRRSSLAGSELSLVRNFLNRIIAIGDKPAASLLPDDALIARSLVLEDETADAALALEQGEEFTAAPGTTRTTEDQKEIERKRAAQVKASRSQIAQAVSKFNARLKAKAESGQMNSFDVLRLRAMLMIIAAAGRPQEGTSRSTSLQVLPLSNDDDGWPRLMGQLLFACFGGRYPAIRRLEIEAIHDHLPDDIFESWATALWGIQACICAASAHKVMRKSTLPAFSRLAEQIYVRTGLQRTELEGDAVQMLLLKLNDRFSSRLGIMPSNVEKAHATTVALIHRTRAGIK